MVKIMANRSDSIIFAALSAFMVMVSSSLGAAVQAELDRNRIIEGETITLTLHTDDARQNLDSDLSVLERDFEILDRRSETQLSIVNGRQTAVVRLLVTLEPKAAGEFVIPALTFGGNTTSEIRVRVDPAPELEPGSQPPVFIEWEVMPDEGPYFVHAQVGLVVRVFYQQNLTEAAISQPEPSPAAVRLMQETPYQAERGGERYRVLERVYAVFPERSGELLIPPMKLTGRLVERRTGNVWQPAARGRRVQVESEALRLNIEPRPAGFTGPEWQPARDYRLTQQISSGDSLRVGEPVTRTVIIDAVGLEENMIAEPGWPELPDTRIYPDQPQGITRDDGQWVLGHKEFRYAVVPEQEGELILPELKVEWWDTVNNRARTAVLPSHTLLVQPSSLAPPPVPVSPVAGQLSIPRPGDAPGEPSLWRWLTMLFAALWVLTLVAAWKLKSKGDSSSARELPKTWSGGIEREEWSRLEQACKSGDRRKARRALQHWLRVFEGNGSLLEFAVSSGDPAIREGIYALDGDGFRSGADSGMGASWDGKKFWDQFERWHLGQSAAQRKNAPPLTDLYAKENRVS